MIKIFDLSQRERLLKIQLNKIKLILCHYGKSTELV